MTPRRTSFLWTTTLLLLGSLFAASFREGVRAAPGLSPAQDNIVISEFRTRGEGGVYDEFVELFNPTRQNIDIGGWIIRRSSSCGTSTYDLAAIASPRSLAPGQHYLVASGDATGLLADQTYPSSSSSSVADNGGIAIFDPDQSQPVDSVGMCATTLYVEGTNLNPLTTDVNRSYERAPGGASGNCTDTDGNASDFNLINPGNPQNASSPLTAACTPAMPTPTNTSTSSTLTSTATHTSTATSPSIPVIINTPTRTFTPTATSTSVTNSTSTSTTTFTATFTTTFTTTPTRTQTSSGSAITITPTITPRIFISEFRTRGSNGAEDEFVELYNATGGAVNIGGWTVRRSSSCGSTIASLVTINAGMILQPGQHYLMISNTNSSLSDADQTFSPAIADDGGIALLDISSILIDQVGMCATTAYQEGTPLAPLSGTTNQGYERRPGGSTSCSDNNNNATDFQLISPSNPQNRASPIVLCAGVLTYTPTTTFTLTRTPTRISTATQTVYPGFVVLNEFLPRPASDWNEDGEANSRDEYIELINMGVADINIGNWKLDDIANGGSDPYILPDLTLIQYQIVRFYASETGISLSDGGDTVRLIKPDGHTTDIQNYAVVAASDRTWCRLPDGNGAWAFACFPTPGRLNAR
ncbi:MAG: lamin tail domain-containing protein, partial [Lentisphaerota bacterium]